MSTGLATSYGFYLLSTLIPVRAALVIFAVKRIGFRSDTPRRSWRGAYPKKCWLGCCKVSWVISQSRKTGLVFVLQMALEHVFQTALFGTLRCSLGYFHNIKCQRGFQIHVGVYYVSHEAFRRMAVCTVQLTGNHTKPASRGIFRATAVKSRPSRISPYAPARLRRAGRGAGRREEACIQWMQPP